MDDISFINGLYIISQWIIYYLSMNDISLTCMEMVFNDRSFIIPPPMIYTPAIMIYHFVIMIYLFSKMIYHFILDDNISDDMFHLHHISSRYQ